MLLAPILWILAGLILLTVGADRLVAGASRLATRLGIPSLVIGLTVVAFGTSAPELAVSTAGALKGSSDLALGNVVGSNLFNILFILGACALILPLAIGRQLIRVDVPVMILASLLCWGMCADGRMSRMEGIVLLAGLAAYTWVQVVIARRHRQQQGSEQGTAPASTAQISPAWSVLWVVVGLVLLVVGADWLVDGSVRLARWLGISELVIGLTIVAAGTSLPEVATSIMATIKGEREIAVGNVVGSNIFNIGVVLGLSVVISGNLPVSPDCLALDMPLMVLTAVVCLPFFISGHRLSRLEGGVLLAAYAGYVLLLVLVASLHLTQAQAVRWMWYAGLPVLALACLPLLPGLTRACPDRHHF